MRKASHAFSELLHCIISHFPGAIPDYIHNLRSPSTEGGNPFNKTKRCNMLKISDKTQAFYSESRAYDSIEVQRLMAEAAYMRSKTLAELFGRAIRGAGGIAGVAQVECPSGQSVFAS